MNLWPKLKLIYLEKKPKRTLAGVLPHLTEIHQDCDQVTFLLKHVFHFPRAFSELLELSSLVCRRTIHVQQSMEEEQLGPARIRELYCPKQ